jgi:hypothetical protein
MNGLVNECLLKVQISFTDEGVRREMDDPGAIISVSVVVVWMVLLWTIGPHEDVPHLEVV